MSNTGSEYKIEKIIREIEEKKLKNVYNEYNDVINLISSFIIKKKLILYGGFVINIILPKKLRFYKCCFSTYNSTWNRFRIKPN